MKKVVYLVWALAPVCALAQARDNFIRQQAYQEMQRVSGQIDVVQNNVSDLQTRVSRLERASGDGSVQQEIAALKSAIAELRRELAAQRGEIVRDLSGRISKMQKETQPPPAPAPKVVTYKGPCQEYVVQAGDTLSLIAQAFDTKIDTLKSMNNLKNHNLRIGQKLLVPKAK